MDRILHETQVAEDFKVENEYGVYITCPVNVWSLIYKM